MIRVQPHGGDSAQESVELIAVAPETLASLQPLPAGREGGGHTLALAQVADQLESVELFLT